jgi:hypothetical protein
MIKVAAILVPKAVTTVLVDETVSVRVLFDDVSVIEIGGLADISNSRNRVSAARLLNTAGELILPANEKLYGYQNTSIDPQLIKMLIISIP